MIAGSAGSSAGAGHHCSVGRKAWAPEARGASLRGGGRRRRCAVTAGACSTPRVEHAGHGLCHAASAPVASGTPHASCATTGSGAVEPRRRLAGPRTGGVGVVASCCPPGPCSTGGWGCMEGAPMPCRTRPAGQGAKAPAGRVHNCQGGGVGELRHCRHAREARIYCQHAIRGARGGERRPPQEYGEASGRV